MANPFHRPFSPERGFEHLEPLTGKEAMRGHPTAPGPRDPYRNRVGRQDVRDGSPGRPRLIMGPMSHGPGIPGSAPSGPNQPGIIYEGEQDQ